jgi:hypothetical protein
MINEYEAILIKHSSPSFPSFLLLTRKLFSKSISKDPEHIPSIMLFNNMILLALANLATLAVADRPAHKSATPSFGEEGHTRVFSMASAPTGMVPH